MAQRARPLKVGLSNALGLLVGYLVLMAAFALGLQQWLGSLEDRLSADTARLLARDQASLVLERSLETLRYPDSDSRRRLRQRISDLTLLSETVTSMAGGGPRGESGRERRSRAPWRAGRRYGRFPDRHLSHASPSSGGVPSSAAATMSSSFPSGRPNRSSAISASRCTAIGCPPSYQDARGRLLGLTLLGLAGVGCLGAFLQVQLLEARRLDHGRSRRRHAAQGPRPGPRPARRVRPSPARGQPGEGGACGRAAAERATRAAGRGARPRRSGSAWFSSVASSKWTMSTSVPSSSSATRAPRSSRGIGRPSARVVREDLRASRPGRRELVGSPPGPHERTEGRRGDPSAGRPGLRRVPRAPERSSSLSRPSKRTPAWPASSRAWAASIAPWPTSCAPRLSAMLDQPRPATREPGSRA